MKHPSRVGGFIYIFFSRSLLLAVSLGLFFLSCQKPTASTPLTVATNVWPGYEPLYLARSLGIFQEDRIRLIECTSATQVLRLFRNGDVDVAALTLDEVLLLRQDRIDVQVFLVTDISQGGDAILGSPGTGELAGLVGRRIGVEPNALGAYMLTRACEESGLAVNDFEIVPLEIHEQEKAYVEGKIDGVVTFEPVRSRLLARGAEVLFDSRQLPSEIVDVLVTRAATLSSRKSDLRALVAGWFHSLAHLEDHPEDAAARMARRLDLSGDSVLTAYGGLHLPDLEENLRSLSGRPSPLEITARRLRKVLLDHQLLERSPDLQALTNREIVVQAGASTTAVR